jgi:hypothetical protein
LIALPVEPGDRVSKTALGRIGGFAIAAVTVALVTSGCASKSPIRAGAPDSGAPSPASSVGISSAIALTASQTPSTVKATGSGKFCQQVATSINQAAARARSDLGDSAVDLKDALTTQIKQTQSLEAAALKSAPSSIKADLLVLFGMMDTFDLALEKAGYDFTKIDPSVLSSMRTPDVMAAEQRLTDYLKNTCGIDAGAGPAGSASPSS